jgi:NAD(P)-dependent dehydrogenase (short-subunit alcohol dehydrogenase family)
MTLVGSLHANANTAVIGASGGIGRAFVNWLADDDRVDSVYAFSRSPVDWGNRARIHGATLDLTDEASIQAASELATAHSPLDLVIVASGILHRDPDIRPEKGMREVDPQALADVFAINTIGPTLVAKHFLPALRRKHKTVFAALSARVGSIADNRLGGWASYRMSKAALNMMVRTMAIEQKRRLPESVVVALHPGTVDTLLSQPFTQGVNAASLFSPASAAEKLLQVVDGLRSEDSGGFFAYDRSPIEY